MCLVSCLSTGMALTKMTGSRGVNSFRRASTRTPVCVSHLAPVRGEMHSCNLHKKK